LAELEQALRQTEAKLGHSEARLRTLLRSTPDIIAIVDPDGTLRYGSPAAAQVLGYADASQLGANMFDLVHPDDREQVAAAGVETMSKPGPGPQIEFRMAHADGHWVWIESVSNNLVHDPEVAGVVITARDVTERREAEAKLAASEARFEAIVANLTDVITVVDARGVVTYATPSARRLVGAERVREGAAGLFGYVHPDDLDQVKAVFARLQAEPGATGLIVNRVMGDDGEVRHVETTATNLLHDPVVQGWVFNTRDVTERTMAEQRLVRQAYHDALTGLPNRTLFLDRLGVALARAERTRHSVAVLFLDLDRFKVINDSLGHDAGDLILTAAAHRLERALRPQDTVARFGGDEFTLLCEDITTDIEPLAIAERVGRVFTEPFAVGEREVFLTASIGIAVAAAPAAAPEVLLRDADAAMYRAKERGRSRAEVFDEAMRDRAVQRMETEHDLHRAIDRGELRLEYQPIIDLAHGRIIGVEALMRWEHPQRGRILPDNFIGLAEETGLIVPLGEWALHEACGQLGAWRRREGVGADIHVSVNLSAGQLAQPRLAQALDAAIDESGIDPSELWLEITESALLEDADAAIATLRRCKDRGISLCIDDFGTGYSSMNYLKRLPIDALKVDRTFVNGLEEEFEDHAITEAVVGLAHSLGLGAVAEGVETPAQLNELRMLGCDGAQGFLFSRPVTADVVSTLLTEQPRW
jgi:diguanylate cyclase (GGDEF)-like protein/PAS domain S-box-containing protein